MDQSFIRAYGESQFTSAPQQQREGQPPAATGNVGSLYDQGRYYRQDDAAGPGGPREPHAGFAESRPNQIAAAAFAVDVAGGNGVTMVGENAVVVGSHVILWPPAPAAEPAGLADEPTANAGPQNEHPSREADQHHQHELATENVAAAQDAGGIAATLETLAEEGGSIEQPAAGAQEACGSGDEQTAAVCCDQPSEAAPQKSPAAWEVDRFAWPDDADRLYQSEDKYFQHAGHKLFAANREGLRVLALGATREGEGCTTLAICLARAAAAAGAKVALLDGDIASPELGATLGLEFARSWHEAGQGAIPLAEAAVASLEDGVTLIPLSAQAAPQAVTLNDPATTNLLRQAADQFDLVLVDLGKVDADALWRVGDAVPVDAAIIVRDMRHTSEQETLASVGHFKRLGIDAVGVAENFRPRQQAA